MSSQVRLVLMNLAVVGALYYRWHLGAPVRSLVVAGLIMFLLVNVLILLTREKSASTK
jgi:hypothetical protein